MIFNSLNVRILFSCFFLLTSSHNLRSQTITFQDEGLKDVLLNNTGGSWTTVYDENGNSFKVDINQDGEIQLEEALSIYALSIPTWGLDTTIADLIHFKNVEKLTLKDQSINSFLLDGYTWILLLNGKFL